MIQQRIVTFTINPALDESVSVAHVMPDRKLRCSEPVDEPGGGGINVARAIRKLGGDALAWFPAAGPIGELLVSLLEVEGVRHQVLAIRGSTRKNLNVLETSSGRQFRFCMPGPTLGDGEWRQALDQLAGLEPGPELAVLSGSLAPGTPADFYAHATERLRRRGARVIIDASGEALACCSGGGAFLLKTSLHEFETWTGVTGADEPRLVELAAKVVAGGACEVLVLSLGAGGALWMTRGERGRLAAPSVPVRSTVGAGDSLVAGIVLSLARGRPLREAMRYGVAAGSATVMQPGTALCRLEDVERLYSQIAI